MDYEKRLGQSIAKIYLGREFGKVLKTEIDALVFHHALCTGIDSKLLVDGEIADYFAISKADIRKLSLKIRIPETRVAAMVERDFLCFGKDQPIANHLLRLVNAHNIRKDSFQSGKLRFVISNPVARKAIEEIVGLGGIPDFSFNREILTLDVYDFLRLVGSFSDERIREVITKNLLAKAIVDSSDPKYIDFMTKLNQRSVGEVLKEIAQGVLAKALGQGADLLIGELFEHLGIGAGKP